VDTNEAMRLTDEDSGPGFVLIHDGVFRKYSLVPGTTGTVVPRSSAPITLCDERHHRGGFVLFEPTLPQLELDNRLNWAFYGPSEYPPSDTVAVVQINDAGACLSDIRTHVGIMTQLQSASTGLRGVAYDVKGEHAVSCRLISSQRN